jgi:hypothetical protein
MPIARRIACLLILVTLATAGVCRAAEPQEVLKAYIVDFVKVLRDPAYAGGPRRPSNPSACGS